MSDDEDDASTTSCSMDICDVIVPIAPEAAPCDTVHFHASYSKNDNSNNNNNGGYYIPLEKVGKNYRHLARRRGAAVHSQLLKDAFEASMSSNEFSDESDHSDKADDYSMYASNSTLASRDGIEDIATTPRKRSRHNDDNDDTTATANTSATLGHLFWGHGIEDTTNSALHPQCTTASIGD
jgi:hypothetical protein